jgi:hypothetical protein
MDVIKDEPDSDNDDFWCILQAVIKHWRSCYSKTSACEDRSGGEFALVYVNWLWRMAADIKETKRVSYQFLVGTNIVTYELFIRNSRQLP